MRRLIGWFGGLGLGGKILTGVVGVALIAAAAWAVKGFLTHGTDVAADKAEEAGRAKAANEAQAEVLENVGKAKSTHTVADPDRDERLSGQWNAGPAKR